MNTEPITNRCPKCQAPLPANAPQGLCPKCLLAAVSTPTDAGQPADRTPPPSVETVAAAFPQLEILELIGHGGMGVVYKARQPRLDRLVALKLLPQSLAADAAFAERFNREARVLARLNHPNIVTVHDFGQSGGFFYLLMEFVDGVNLRQAMQAGRFTPQQAMMLVPKICEALQFAHDEGILHRDIKPENILLDTRGRVKIADYGIAKLVGEAREKLTLTASGSAIGTPHYMAPEQLEHPQDVDQRADIYSLGVVFYEMLTGELPIGRFAPPSQKTAVDARVDEVVFHALEKEREKRFRTATEVKTSVEAITAHPAAGSAQPPPANAPTQPSPGVAAPEHGVPCYFNTPARMRDCFPSAAARVFTCKGELQLDAENLAFTSTWRTTITIPLKDIEDLSVGQFQMWSTPWLMKYARINYLSITFRRDQQAQTVHLTPVEPGAASASQVNDCVGRWHERVRQAVRKSAGTMPRVSEPASISVSAEPAFNRRIMPLVWTLLVVGAVPWLLPAQTGTLPILFSIMVVVTLLCVLLLWHAAGFLRANSALHRANLDAVTSEDPPAAEPTGAGAGRGPGRKAGVRPFYASSVVVMVLVFVAVLEITLQALRTSHFQAPSERVPGGPSASGTPSAPESEGKLVLERLMSRPRTSVIPTAPASEGQFVLYTMPVQGTNAPGIVLWNFNNLVPAQHLVRILFVCWSNGVPEIGRAGSAYYKVGKTPMEQDLRISCEQPDPRFHDPTNIVRWYFSHNTSTGQGVSRVLANHPLTTPSRMTVHSGHQGILRLMDETDSNGQSAHLHSGVELRIFLEPMKYPPVRTDPFEVEGANYVTGHGTDWTTEQALTAIKDWPVDK